MTRCDAVLWREAWKRDQKAYYASANAKAFRAALDKEVTAKSFVEVYYSLLSNLEPLSR